VYVAEIRENRNSYLEHYPCRSFNAAMAVIHGFCQEYAVALNDNSTVEIKKYRVLGEDDDFDECELGEICLDRDLEIVSADYWPLEENLFINADGTSSVIRFPDFLPPCCPVSYTDFRGRQYGMQVNALREGDDDYAYVIELDADSVNAGDLSGFGNAHLHVPFPLVEQLELDQLPEKERANYLRLESYLRSRGLI